MKEYTVETKEQTPISFHKSKIVAILRCIFDVKARYVFEFHVDDNDDYELIGCVFIKA